MASAIEELDKYFKKAFDGEGFIELEDRVENEEEATITKGSLQTGNCPSIDGSVSAKNSCNPHLVAQMALKAGYQLEDIFKYKIVIERKK